jgi:hypothetical protein
VPEQLARQMDGALLAIGALSETLKAKVRVAANVGTAACATKLGGPASGGSS